MEDTAAHLAYRHTRLAQGNIRQENNSRKVNVCKYGKKETSAG
jgi:hypothetical protein